MLSPTGVRRSYCLEEAFFICEAYCIREAYYIREAYCIREAFCIREAYCMHCKADCMLGALLHLSVSVLQGLQHLQHLPA
jgi:hypothetical protein